jgi:hypothetical protein
MEQFIWLLMGGVPSLLTGLVLAKISKSESKAEQREKERQEREELTLQSMDALFCVTKELVECTLHGKTPNGELQEAYAYKQQAKHRLEEYERKQAVKS